MKKLVKKYYPQLLLVILAFTFFTRVYRLHIPEKYIFDEVYHAVTAKLIAENDTRAYEWTNPPPEPDTAVDWLHPPLAKYTQAASMKLFSQNSFGWRFSSVIFGVLTVFLTAKLAMNIFKDKLTALIAALVTSMDGLILTMSRIAMNDIHVTTFILLSFNLYSIYLNKKRKNKKYLVLATISSGLAMGTKWSGLFPLLLIGFLEGVHLLLIFIKEIKKSNLKKKLISLSKNTTILFIVSIFLPALIYILSYSHMFLLGKDFNHLIEMHKNIWWYQTTLEATHPAQSKPYQWFLNLKPVWIQVDWKENSRGDIYAFGNPAIFWLGDVFIFVTLGYIIFSAKKNKTGKKEKIKQLSLILAMYLIVWLPWQLSPRIMFFYHYLPAVPLMSINLAYWTAKFLKGKNIFKAIGLIILTAIIVCFIVWYPHWVGIIVSNEFKDKVYFAIDSWKQS